MDHFVTGVYLMHQILVVLFCFLRSLSCRGGPLNNKITSLNGYVFPSTQQLYVWTCFLSKLLSFVNISVNISGRVVCSGDVILSRCWCWCSELHVHVSFPKSSLSPSLWSALFVTILLFSSLQCPKINLRPLILATSVLVSVTAKS